ncbi:MAG: hypothetical protein HY000_30075 [Planctomycetes bacterium]|nr:hypothetical protein [Planctomycetota bacterium]
MTYTVVWRPIAEAMLARLWIDAPNRQAVTDAADHLDAILRMPPRTIGESRTADTRIAFQGPGVLYEIREEDQVVAVLAVWRIAERSD